ncbi:MAG TPA: transcription-repair coupling factor [Gammaproteobacteria bacterium]|nr:transcription-repair coupling factor [Gammaproteobacteria bacterium]
MDRTWKHLPLPVAAARPLSWGQLYGAAPALAIAEAAVRHAGPVLVLAGSPRQADQLAAEIAFFGGAPLEVLLLPDAETLPWDAFSPHPDITSRRLATLSRLPSLARGVVVTATQTLLQRLPPPAWTAMQGLDIAAGDRLDPVRLRRQLQDAGYLAVPQVTEHGEFALRGSLLDLYPMGSELPYRIDLFDDVVDSIRQFDPGTQRSLDRLERIRLLPGREYPFAEDAIRAFRARFRERFPGDPSRVGIYRDLGDGIASGGLEYYLPLFFEDVADLADYLPDGTLLVEAEPAAAALEQAWAGVLERHGQLAHDIERPILDPEEVFASPPVLASRLAQFPTVRLAPFKQLGDGADLGAAAPPALKLNPRAPEPAAALLDFLLEFEGRVLFTAESPGRREVLRGLLAGRGIATTSVSGWPSFLAGTEPRGLAVAPLEDGLLLPAAGLAVIAETQLFGERARQRTRRRRGARDPEAVIRELADLHAGAPVVHAEYGVGRYLGLDTLEVQGRSGEFLTLEYAGGDKLYVPVQSLDLISRYTGASPESAPLHRLGGDQWQKARRRAAEKVRDVAVELLDLHARRAARQGHGFALPEQDYAAFRDGFPFDETPDQRVAIEQVIEDMTTAQPMDRVICGDVGFGKTEVALRAAFVAVQDGRQVAMLVPTTLLAQQHFQTFSDRFADWPIRIEALSRFRSRKDVQGILDGLQSGTVDIVIGTHKLLQHTVHFRNLGLVIIDEEHRFGVRDKERLKAMRAEVDVLTLTATPIPRTMNMALGGLRDLSMITTPPTERLAVKTFVTEWNDGLVREACLREIRRGGQVYFLHNDVQTIDDAAARLGELVPEARIRVAHGQMRERDLEQVMLDFYHRRFNVLVCSTIIESGIDIPTANTIIVQRADKLGLAQLHQLRGRVGRSHHRAYAYLVTPPRNAMTSDAVKRLEAVESLEDLGAGFTLATHDLEIRGAGELLGDEQSGQIHEIGFSMYMEMLERAVAALRSGKEPDLDRPLDFGVEVELGVAALLPADYVPDVHQRLVLYKRIAGTIDADALQDLQAELIDRFGLLPPQAQTLFLVAAIRQRAARLGIRRIEANAAGGSLLFRADTCVEPAALIRLIQSDAREYRLDGQDKLRFNLDLTDPERRFATVHRLLDALEPAREPVPSGPLRSDRPGTRQHAH